MAAGGGAVESVVAPRVLRQLRAELPAATGALRAELVLLAPIQAAGGAFDRCRLNYHRRTRRRRSRNRWTQIGSRSTTGGLATTGPGGNFDVNAAGGAATMFGACRG